MKSELIFTDTNAASDSAGRTWGLEGNLFWWLIGGLGVGITVFFVMVLGFKAGLFLSFGVAAVPALLCLVYIFTLRQGKPPGYDRDCLEYILSGRGFGPEADRLRVPKHPLL